MKYNIFRQMISANGTLLILILVCVILSAARLTSVAKTSLYVSHIDEKHIYAHAVDVLDGPDLNPNFFRYPSLPIYISAVTLGVSRALRGLHSVKLEVPVERGLPYIPAGPFRDARLVFGVLGCLVFLWVGFLTRQLTGTYQFAWLAPLVLGLSFLMQRLVVRYHNVDTPTAFFVFATLAIVIGWWNSESWFKKAIAPGVLCGLTAACKYNSGIILIPCALAIFLAPEVSSRWRKLFVLGACTVAAFLLAVPYSLFDFSHFYKDILYEMNHYRTGHPGNDGPPGLPQLLFYLKALHLEFGNAICTLAVVGVGYVLWLNPRKALVFLAFPVLMLAHMSTNRVHFLRTILPLFIFIPVLAAVGATAIAHGMKACSSLIQNKQKRIAVLMAGMISLCLILIWIVLLDEHRAELADRNIKADTRVQAIAWVQKNTPKYSRILLSGDVSLFPQDFPDHSVQLLPIALLGADKVIFSQKKPAILIVGDYGKSTRFPKKIRNFPKKKEAYLRAGKENAKLANHRLQQLVSKLGVKAVANWKGRKAHLRWGESQPAELRNNPALNIYELPLDSP